MKEKRRIRGSFAAMVADPGRKLLALVLAVILWFFINSQITREVKTPLSLVTVGSSQALSAGLNQLAVVLPTDKVVGTRFLDGERQIDTVSVVMKGPRYLVDTVSQDALGLLVTGFAGLGDWNTRTSVEFTAADIQRSSRTLQDVTLELEPSRIRLEVERIDEWAIPLSLEVVDLVGDQLGTRLRKETAEFSPPSARVLGPASSIKQFRDQPQRFKAQLKGSPNERQVTAIVELVAPASLGLRLAETPSLSIKVRTETRVFQVEVPLSIDDQALPVELRGQYQLAANDATRLVRVRAGGDLLSQLVNLGENPDKNRLKEWVQAHLRLLTWIPPLEAGTTPLPELILEAQLVLRGPLQLRAIQDDYGLDEQVSVVLHRKP